MVALTMLLLLGYAISSFGIGRVVIAWLVKDPRDFIWITASVILGFYLSVWAVYILSIVFQSQYVPFFLITCIGLFLLKPKFRSIPFSDILALVCSVGISTWIMFKAFHAGQNGMVLIGSNEVFDYGHALSVIRSFSTGANIPYSSPFIAGELHVYHFLFYFWVGLLERFGIPVVFAFNLPSIISLSALLMMVYGLAKYYFTSVFAGFIAMYFILTHSTLMFWYYLQNHSFQSIWQNGKYFFAGPYDGSPISIFWTLNVLVNQRHLVFGMAVVLVLYFIAMQSKSKPAILGILCGLLVWWHTTLFMACSVIIGLLFILQKKYAFFLWFAVISGLVAFAQLFPWLANVSTIRQYEGQQALFFYFLSSDFIGLLRYWWMNLSVAIITIPSGYFVVLKNQRIFFLPFIGLFILANFIRFGSDIAENHKFLNLIFVMGSILSAGFVARLFQRKIVVSIIVIILLSVSGIIDLMVIKNDFQYPVEDFGASNFMRWMRDETKPESVFLSYQDIFDPVTLSGRKTYFGFFGAKAYPEKSIVVRSIYERPNTITPNDYHIDYVVVPKWKKNDFPYIVDEAYFRKNMGVAYEDDRHVVFAIP